MPLFKSKYTIVKVKKREIPDGLWAKCEDCSDPIYYKILGENYKVCPKCQHHYVLTAPERISLLMDEGSFKECDTDLMSCDPLGFKGPKKSTPFVANLVAKDVVEKVKDYGLKKIHVFVKNIGRGREAAVRALYTSGLDLLSIKDVTPTPHGGCRPPKARRV